MAAPQARSRGRCPPPDNQPSRSVARALRRSLVCVEVHDRVRDRSDPPRPPRRTPRSRCPCLLRPRAPSRRRCGSPAADPKRPPRPSAARFRRGPVACAERHWMDGRRAGRRAARRTGRRSGFRARSVDPSHARLVARCGPGPGPSRSAAAGQVVKITPRTDEVLAPPDPVNPRWPGLERKAARASVWVYPQRRGE